MLGQAKVHPPLGRLENTLVGSCCHFRFGEYGRLRIGALELKEVAGALKEYEDLLLARPEFMRVGRSYIVNILQTRADAELQRSMLEAELKQAEIEVAGLRSVETQVAVYQHDMRHHLTAMDGFTGAFAPLMQNTVCSPCG